MSGKIATQVDGASARQVVRRLRLYDSAGQLVSELAKPRASIGQEPSNDVVLTDKTISRFHCEIVIDGGAARVRDLESRNGTWVNGTRVVEAHLADGAELRVGRTLLRIAFGDERVAQPLSEKSELGPLVGRSLAMRSAFALLELAAPSDATVLLEETGTGKEGAAEALHLGSPRRDKPLVVVDCSAIPANLIESELFGHEKGAFTGATSRQVGAFEEADGGTVLLDEVGELPLDLQPKLLRVLERREIKPVGSPRRRPLDVRVIAATHRDLRAGVNNHTYRADLYFRLSVVRITLPPLRDRPDDIPLLAERILQRLAAPPQVLAQLLAPEFLAALQRHSWPATCASCATFSSAASCFSACSPSRRRSRRARCPSSAPPVSTRSTTSSESICGSFCSITTARRRWRRRRRDSAARTSIDCCTSTGSKRGRLTSAQTGCANARRQTAFSTVIPLL